MDIRPFSAEIMVKFTMKALAFTVWMAIRPFSAEIMVKFTMGKLACQAYS